MINLMPKDAKSTILYARRNLRLMHWTFGSIAIIAAMAATVVLGGFYIENVKGNLNSTISDTKKTIETQKLNEVKKEAENLSDGVKLIVKVLSKEVRFSKLLQELGGLMPNGATLGSLELSNQVNGALDLTANAVNYESATQVQVNLEDPKNNIFQKVDTITVSCNDTAQSSSGLPSKYKCQITVRALFKTDAAVTFLASPPNGSKP